MVPSLVRRTLAALALTLAACSTSTLSGMHLDITPDKPQYAAGSPAMVTIRNVGDETVRYSFCAAEIQRQTPSGWVTESAELVSCTRIGLELAPGASATGRVDLPASLPAGTYRVYFPGIGDPVDGEAAADLQSRKSSKPFTVTAG
jgi:methionine-rich copper-binding protein CopC